MDCEEVWRLDAFSEEGRTGRVEGKQVSDNCGLLIILGLGCACVMFSLDYQLDQI